MKHTIDGLMYCIKALRTIEAHSRPMPWAADVDEAVKQQEAAVRAYAEAMLAEASPRGMYCWIEEYPEEGSIYLDKLPPPPTDSTKGN